MVLIVFWMASSFGSVKLSCEQKTGWNVTFACVNFCHFLFSIFRGGAKTVVSTSCPSSFSKLIACLIQLATRSCRMRRSPYTKTLICSGVARPSLKSQRTKRMTMPGNRLQSKQGLEGLENKMTALAKSTQGKAIQQYWRFDATPQVDTQNSRMSWTGTNQYAVIVRPNSLFIVDHDPYSGRFVNDANLQNIKLFINFRDKTSGLGLSRILT